MIACLNVASRQRDEVPTSARAGLEATVAVMGTALARIRAEELAQKEQKTLRKLLELQERDRKLVAHDIHDGLAQQLTGALMQLQAYENLRGSHPGDAQEAFDAGTDLLRQSIDEAVRDLDAIYRSEDGPKRDEPAWAAEIRAMYRRLSEES